jgi:hypothetical protein
MREDWWQAGFEPPIVCKTGAAWKGGHWIREPHQEGKPMQAIAKSGESGVLTTSDIIEQTMPDPVRRPPGRPPGEPIIIKDPSRPPETPEIDGSLDEGEEEVPEIKRRPITPEMPPPPGPGEQAD